MTFGIDMSCYLTFDIALCSYPHVNVSIRDFVGCIDKWVKSKPDNATPPELCSGPKQAIWKKNQPSSPEKTPMIGQKSKMAILPLFGHARVLGEKAIVEYNNSYCTVFNLYDIFGSRK